MTTVQLSQSIDNKPLTRSCNPLHLISMITKIALSALLWFPNLLLSHFTTEPSPIHPALEPFTGEYGSAEPLKRWDIDTLHYDANCNLNQALKGLSKPVTDVKLLKGKDYALSANYIAPIHENRKQADIASNCPKIQNGSLDAFMRMIWDNKVDTVVNLTDAHNDTSSNLYLQELQQGHGIKLLNNASIKLLKKQDLGPDFTEYQFKISKKFSSRTITFLHFQQPSKDLRIERMTKLIDKIQQIQSKNPKLIHCSLGTDRTGIVFTLLNAVAFLQKKLP